MATDDRECPLCVHAVRGGTEEPCATCLDGRGHPKFERAERRAHPPRGRATGITADDLVQCDLCEGKFHPVAMRTKTLCSECNHVEMIVRCHTTLVRKILRKLNKELVDHDN